METEGRSRWQSRTHAKAVGHTDHDIQANGPESFQDRDHFRKNPLPTLAAPKMKDKLKSVLFAPINI